MGIDTGNSDPEDGLDDVDALRKKVLQSLSELEKRKKEKVSALENEKKTLLETLKALAEEQSDEEGQNGDVVSMDTEDPAPAAPTTKVDDNELEEGELVPAEMEEGEMIMPKPAPRPPPHERRVPRRQTPETPVSVRFDRMLNNVNRRPITRPANARAPPPVSSSWNPGFAPQSSLNVGWLPSMPVLPSMAPMQSFASPWGISMPNLTPLVNQLPTFAPSHQMAPAMNFQWANTAPVPVMAQQQLPSQSNPFLQMSNSPFLESLKPLTPLTSAVPSIALSNWGQQPAPSAPQAPSLSTWGNDMMDTLKTEPLSPTQPLYDAFGFPGAEPISPPPLPPEDVTLGEADMDLDIETAVDPAGNIKVIAKRVPVKERLSVVTSRASDADVVLMETTSTAVPVKKAGKKPAGTKKIDLTGKSAPAAKTEPKSTRTVTLGTKVPTAVNPAAPPPKKTDTVSLVIDVHDSSDSDSEGVRSEPAMKRTSRSKTGEMIQVLKTRIEHLESKKKNEPVTVTIPSKTSGSVVDNLTPNRKLEYERLKREIQRREKKTSEGRGVKRTHEGTEDEPERKRKVNVQEAERKAANLKAEALAARERAAAEASRKAELDSQVQQLRDRLASLEAEAASAATQHAEAVAAASKLDEDAARASVEVQQAKMRATVATPPLSRGPSPDVSRAPSGNPSQRGSRSSSPMIDTEASLAPMVEQDPSPSEAPRPSEVEVLAEEKRRQDELAELKSALLAQQRAAQDEQQHKAQRKAAKEQARSKSAAEYQALVARQESLQKELAVLNKAKAAGSDLSTANKDAIAQLVSQTRQRLERPRLPAPTAAEVGLFEASTPTCATFVTFASSVACIRDVACGSFNEAIDSGADSEDPMEQVVATIDREETITPRVKESRITFSSASYETPLLGLRSYRLTPQYTAELNLPLDWTVLSNKIDPNRMLCQFELDGVCNDDKCTYQHERDSKLSPEELAMDIASYAVTGATPQARRDAAQLLVERARVLLSARKAGDTDLPKVVLEIVSKQLGKQQLKGKTKGQASVLCQPRRTWSPALAERATRQAIAPAGRRRTGPAQDGDAAGSSDSDNEIVEIDRKASTRDRYYNVHPTSAAAYDERLRREPHRVDLWLEFAASFTLSHPPTEAQLDQRLAVLARALEAHPHDEDVWRTYLWLFIRRGSVQEAAELCTAGLKYLTTSHFLWRLQVSLSATLPTRMQVLTACLQCLLALPIARAPRVLVETLRDRVISVANVALGLVAHEADVNGSGAAADRMKHLTEALAIRLGLGVAAGDQESWTEGASRGEICAAIEPLAALWLCWAHLRAFDAYPEALSHVPVRLAPLSHASTVVKDESYPSLILQSPPLLQLNWQECVATRAVLDEVREFMVDAISSVTAATGDVDETVNRPLHALRANLAFLERFHQGPDAALVVFDRWHTEDTEELVELKAKVVEREGYFIASMEVLEAGAKRMPRSFRLLHRIAQIVLDEQRRPDRALDKLVEGVLRLHASYGNQEDVGSATRDGRIELALRIMQSMLGWPSGAAWYAPATARSLFPRGVSPGGRGDIYAWLCAGLLVALAPRKFGGVVELRRLFDDGLLSTAVADERSGARLSMWLLYLRAMRLRGVSCEIVTQLVHAALAELPAQCVRPVRVAEERFERLLVQDYTLANALIDEHITSLKHAHERAEFLFPLVSQWPSNTTLALTAAKLDAAAGRLSHAGRTLAKARRAPRSAPLSVEVWLHLIRLELVEDDPVEALRLAKAAVVDDPWQPRLWQQLEMVARRFGDSAQREVRDMAAARQTPVSWLS